MSTEWTLTTLKELFDEKLRALDDKCSAETTLLHADIQHAAEALVKQATEYERRLTALNGESDRLKTANAGNVGREVYDADKRSDDEWKRRIEGQVASSVPQSEYRAYKEATEKALTTATARREGAGGLTGGVLQVLLAAGVIASIGFGIVNLLARPTTPQPVVYSAVPQAAAPVAPIAPVR